MRHILAALLSALSLQATYAVEHWNQFRGPQGNGISTAENLPVEFDEAKNVRWKTQLLKKNPSVREKVESGGATKEQVIDWMKWQARIKGKRDGK